MTFVLILVLFSRILWSSATQSLIFTERFRWSPANYDFEEAGLHINETSYNLWDFAPDKLHPWKDKLFFIQTDLKFRQNTSMIHLAYVDLNTTEKSPKLIPYLKDLSTGIYTYTLEIDTCDRLWFIDIDSGTLHIINLTDNKPIRDVKLNFDGWKFIHSLTVDVNTSNCEDTYAYMVNFANNEIYVYRLKDDKYWSAGKPNFQKDESKNFTFANWLLILQSSALSSPDGDGNRVLFLQTLSSKYLTKVSTDILQNSENSNGSLNLTVFGYREQFASSIIHYDERNSILFFSTDSNKAFGCWNMGRFPDEFSVNTTQVVTPSNLKLEDIRDIKSDDQNNLLIFDRHSENPDRYVVHLYTVNIKEFIKDTVCGLV